MVEPIKISGKVAQRLLDEMVLRERQHKPFKRLVYYYKRQWWDLRGFTKEEINNYFK